MFVDIVHAEALDGCRLKIRFEDGVEGIVDVSQCVTFAGVFAPLRDPEVFRSVQVHPELGTVCWPSGADLDPDVLYAVVTGQPLRISILADVQERNRQLARQINKEALRDPQSSYANKFVGIVNGQVVVVADTLDDMARRLHEIEPDPTKTMSVEASMDYSEVIEI